MGVDVHIAGAAKAEVEPSVPRDLLQHVVEEGEAGHDFDPPASFERDPRSQLRFIALANNLCASYSPRTQRLRLEFARAPTQGAPRPRARGQSALRAQPGGRQRLAASLGRRG